MFQRDTVIMFVTKVIKDMVRGSYMKFILRRPETVGLKDLLDCDKSGSNQGNHISPANRACLHHLRVAVLAGAGEGKVQTFFYN